MHNIPLHSLNFLEAAPFAMLHAEERFIFIATNESYNPPVFVSYNSKNVTSYCFVSGQQFPGTSLENITVPL